MSVTFIVINLFTTVGGLPKAFICKKKIFTFNALNVCLFCDSNFQNMPLTARITNHSSLGKKKKQNQIHHNIK